MKWTDNWLWKKPMIPVDNLLWLLTLQCERCVAAMAGVLLDIRVTDTAAKYFAYCTILCSAEHEMMEKLKHASFTPFELVVWLVRWCNEASSHKNNDVILHHVCLDITISDHRILLSCRYSMCMHTFLKLIVLAGARGGVSPPTPTLLCPLRPTPPLPPNSRPALSDTHIHKVPREPLSAL